MKEIICNAVELMYLIFVVFFFKFNQLQCNWKKSVKKTDYPKTLPTETVILAYIVFVCFVSLMFVCICVLYSRLYEHHLFLLIIIKMVLNSAILCDSFHVFSSQNQQMVKQCSYINNSCPSACWEVVNGKTFSRVGLFDKKSIILDLLGLLCKSSCNTFVPLELLKLQSSSEKF